jgi:hypothetical protein
MATTSSDAVEVKLFGKWSFEEVEVRGGWEVLVKAAASSGERRPSFCWHPA